MAVNAVPAGGPFGPRPPVDPALFDVKPSFKEPVGLLFGYFIVPAVIEPPA
jgi:hypothetical protein